MPLMPGIGRWEPLSSSQTNAPSKALARLRQPGVCVLGKTVTETTLPRAIPIATSAASAIIAAA